MSDAEKIYAEYIELIQNGFTPLEATARRFAEANDLSLEPLEEATERAFLTLMSVYVQEIENGRVSFANSAYAIAKERNYSTELLDSALASASRSSGGVR
jgi:hypothetical protein